MSACGRPNCVNGWIYDVDKDEAVQRCQDCDPDYKSPEERDRIRREEREVKERRAEIRRREVLEQASRDDRPPRRGKPKEDEEGERRASLPYRD